MKGLISKILRKFGKDADMRELATKSLAAMVMRVMGLLVNYLFLYYVTQRYGAAGWGLFVLCYTVLQMLSMLGSLGFNISMVKLFADPDIDRSRIIWRVLTLVLPVNLVLAGVLYIFAQPISGWFTEGNMPAEYLRYVAFGIVPFTLLLVNAGIYRGLKRVVAYSFFDSLGRFLFGFIAVFLLAFAMDGEQVVVIGFCVGLFALLVFSSLGLTRIEVPKSSEKAKWLSKKELLSLSTSVLWGTLTNRGLYWFSALVLGMYASKADVGVFDTSMRLSQVTSIILFSINSISAPKFAETSGEELRERLAQNVKKTSKLVFWLSVPPGIILMIGAGFFLSFFGEEFVAGKYIMMFLLIGEIINNITGAVGTLMQMAGLHHQYRNLIFAMLLVHVVLSFIFAPIYGALGVAVVYSFTRGMKNLVAAWMVYRAMGINTIYLPGITK